MSRNKENYNEYQRKYQLARYHRRRTAAILALGGKCKVCGGTELLELDHIDPEDKSFGISKLWSVSEKRFLAELSKCQVLCQADHLTKSRNEGSFRNGGGNKISDYGHGTALMYNNDRCRCPTCRQWKRDFRNKLVDSSGHKRSGA